jgi:hypothetical protein
MEFNWRFCNGLRWNCRNLITHCSLRKRRKRIKARSNSYLTIIFTCASLFAPGSIYASTWYAATANQSDVVAAIGRAADGDTVVVPDTLSLPGGAASWTSKINVTVGITIKGQTTITGAGKSSPVIADNTVILDNSPRTGKQSGLVQFNLTPTQRGRITGFTFKAGTSNILGQNGAVQLTSSGTAANYTMRVDHCHFDHVYSLCIQVGGWCMGVADHNVLRAQGSSQSLNVKHGGYNNGAGLGHESWADYPYFGTRNFFFFEDNSVYGDGIVPTSGASDSSFGARYVVRHNYWENARPGWHGTEGGARGTRAVEVYNNTSYWTMIPSASARSGNALYHDNTWDGHDRGGGDPIHSNIVLFRAMGAGGDHGGVFGSADGTSPWDRNDTEGTGTYVPGHPPFLFASGVVTTTAAGGTLRDSTANWAPDRWVGYSVTNMNPAAPSYLKGSIITGNTRTEISYVFYAAGDRGAGLVFRTGDRYEIHRCLTVLDQPGRGKGDLCGGTSQDPINLVTGTPFWPTELREPSFSWNNVYIPTNTAWGFGSEFPQCVERRDFYNLGKGFPPNSTPSQVSAILTAAVNGVQYNRTYTYPHPYTLVGP